MERLNVLTKHLSVSSNASVTTANTSGLSAIRSGPPAFGFSPEDIVVVDAVRTPIGKSKRGSFVETYTDDLLAIAFEGLFKRNKIRPDEIGDVCIGNVNDARDAFTARVAQFFSGMPETVPVSAVNRQCGSGLQAFINIAGGIKNKAYDVAIAGGVEMMSRNAMGGNADAFADLNPKIMDTELARNSLVPMGVEMMSKNTMVNRKAWTDLNPKIMDVQLAKNSLIPMGITSENVAAKYGITREQQDRFSMESHHKAAAATEKGYFRDEIVPVTTTLTDKNGEKRTITVTKDDGIRGNTSMETLAKLKPAFQAGGSTTAGNSSQTSDGAAAVLVASRQAAHDRGLPSNSSQTSDGAAAVLVASRQAAHDRGLPILGTLRAFAVKGCPPEIMGIGPAVAIPEALKMAGLTIDDVDIFEINEAFASQAFYCVQKLGIPKEKVNPKGGAIAFGHPLGATGARMIATLLHEMKRRGKRSFGVVSMCMGTGMGAAAVFEYNP